MIVKTKSGFSCKVNEKKVHDWRFAKSLADCDSGDESRVIKGMTFVVPFLLGEDGEKKLSEHVADKDGIISSESIMKEFREILIYIGQNNNDAKKS